MAERRPARRLRPGGILALVAGAQFMVILDLAGESPLTSRETGVLRVAETGVPTNEIADVLHLSSATVRNYLSNAISEVGARNRIEAIRIARDAGWR